MATVGSRFLRSSTICIVLALAGPCWSETPMVDSSRERAIREAREVLEQEAASHGGWEAWYATLAPFRARWKHHLTEAPDAGAGIIAGDQDFYFFRTWESYVLDPYYVESTDLPVDTPPNTALHSLVDFNRQLLERNTHLIVVPVPSRSEIYPERVLADPPPLPIAPQRKQFLAALMAQGVEGIDLLPAMTQAKASGELSLSNDTHWSTKGVAVAARVIAERLGRYDWAHLYGRAPVTMEKVSVPYARSWAFHDRLPPEVRDAHGAEPVDVTQIRLPDGTPYAHDAHAPLLLAGDSFLFFYTPVQADIAAHVGAQLGYPVATRPVGGGKASDIARTFARMPGEQLSRYRVVVFIFLGPYLRYDHWGTAKLPSPNNETPKEPIQ